MNIGDDRKTERFANLREDGERRREADPARAFGAGAVRLVERCLKDEPDAEARSDLFERGCHFEGVRPAFQLTWTRKRESGKALPMRTPPTSTMEFGLTAILNEPALGDSGADEGAKKVDEVRRAGTSVRDETARR